MLPKANRLFSDYDFAQVRRRGRPLGSPFFSLYTFRDPSLDTSRFGFVVSTRIDKRATKRNRIKRIFRDEVVRLLPKVRPGFSSAFWVRSAALVAPPDRVRASIKESLQKAGIIE